MTLLDRLRAWGARGLWLLTAALTMASGLLQVSTRPEARGHDLLGLPDLLLSLPFVLGSATVGGLLAAKRPGNPVGWLLGTCGLLVSLDQFARAYAIYGLFVQPASLPGATLVAWLNAWTWQLTFGLMLILLPLIFPNGRPPWRTWHPVLWLACAFVAVWSLSAAFGPRTIYLDWRSGYALPNPLGQPGLPGWWLFLASERVGPLLALSALTGAGALAVRLISAGRDERRQLEWIVLAAGISALGVVLIGAIGAPMLGFALLALGLTALPLAAGIAILRHRLFDIEVIISNAVIYTLLTAFLAGLYGGVTTLIQRLSVAFVGQPSDATLVVAAMLAGIAFTPVKNRLQAVVDQHFKSGSSPDTAPVCAPTLAELSAEVARLRATIEPLAEPCLTPGRPGSGARALPPV
jgi:hypothetical protein